MEGFSIGLSGLDAAQKALNVIGNNIANAATEGYHRQRINLTPAYSSQAGSVVLGGGVDVAGVSRMIDQLLEQEILQQQSLLGQVSRESATLQTVESAFGELSTDKGGLNAAMDEFFNALQDLSAHPTETVWQNQAATAADVMTAQFRTLAEFLNRLETQIGLEAGNTIEQINTLINRIAELNRNVEGTEIAGRQSDSLRDQRDQCIAELSKLISVETQTQEYGVVNVSVAGVPVVIGTSATELEVGLEEGDRLGISIAGAQNVTSDVQGGQLGGLLSLRNDILTEIRNDLDTLATTIIQQINQYHVQGVGAKGSFTELTGWRMASENLADFGPSVTDGKIYIRVIDTSTGKIERHEIDIDASTGSLAKIAEDISSITGLTAWVADSRLHIQAQPDYKFDFLPCVLPEPTDKNLTGTLPPTISVSGIYTGTENQTFTFTTIGTGKVGNDNLQLEVRNGMGEVISTLNIGAGYAAGDKLDIGNGIKISLTTGDLNAGDRFEIDARASSDTSGVLAAIGLNTFFSGRNAADIAVCSDISASPEQIATSMGPDMTDNVNVLRLAGLKDQPISSLGAMTPGDFYRQLVTNIGQQLSIRQIRQDNIEAMVQNLAGQQSEISGVDINDEAAQMLVFEQMFQAMAKYLSTVQSSILTMMDLVK